LYPIFAFFDGTYLMGIMYTTCCAKDELKAQQVVSKARCVKIEILLLCTQFVRILFVCLRVYLFAVRIIVTEASINTLKKPVTKEACSNVSFSECERLRFVSKEASSYRCALVGVGEALKRLFMVLFSVPPRQYGIINQGLCVPASAL
jgi:hypothetical protein